MSSAIRLLFFAITICALDACSKNEQSGEKKITVQSSDNQLTAAAAQPLPGGKRNFSVTLGNMDTSPWVRMGNWTFNAAAGTVAATFWTWSYNQKFTVPVLDQHRCTFEGVSKIVNNYTPYGWIEPAGAYMGGSGNSTYDSTTGRPTLTR